MQGLFESYRAMSEELEALRARVAELEASNHGPPGHPGGHGAGHVRHALVDGAPDMWARVDGEGRILDYIPAKGMDSAYSTDAIVGERFTEFMPPEAGGRAMERVRATLDTQKPQFFEYSMPFPFMTDDPRDFEARLVPGRNDEVIVSVRDITDRKQREVRRHDTMMMDAVSELAAGVSESLSNVLAEIIVFSELGGRHLAPDDQMYAFCQGIKSATARASELAGELMTLSHRRSVEPRVFDVNSVVLDMEEVLRRLLGPDGDLMTLLAPEPVWVNMDPGMLKQMLLNLAVNSVEAMSSGGLLVIATGTAALNEDYVVNHPEATAGEYVHVKITDYGPGMIPDVRERAFEPYFTTKGEEGALGMGLPTAYGIVKQAGGYMTVESEHGHGATFNVYIPLAKQTR